MDESQLFDTWGRRVWHARVQAQLAHPYSHFNTVHVGRDVLNMCRRNVTPPPTNYPALHGQIGIIGGMSLIPEDTLQPDEWQLRNHEGTVTAHGRLTDLET